MMREYKYRVWVKKDKKFIYLSSSQLTQYHLQINNEYWSLFDGEYRICGNADNTGILQIDIGKKSITDKNIFDGDIVRFGRPYHGKIQSVFTGSIQYNEYCSAYQIVYTNIYDSSASDFIHNYKIIDVIGTTAENPELLKSLK